MSRVADTSGEASDSDIEAYQRTVRAAYRAAGVKAKLRAFVAFLDVMPVKRIIADRFMEPRTGEMCSVAAYCASRGMPKLTMLKTEGESFAQRLDNDGLEYLDGFEGATVGAGQSAGLSHEIAYDLTYRNDMNWRRVRAVIETTPTVYEERIVETPMLARNDRGRPIGEYAGPWRVIRVRGEQQTIERPTTPEERWQRLRDYLIFKIDGHSSERAAAREQPRDGAIE